MGQIAEIVLERVGLMVVVDDVRDIIGTEIEPDGTVKVALDDPLLDPSLGGGGEGHEDFADRL